MKIKFSWSHTAATQKKWYVETGEHLASQDGVFDETELSPEAREDLLALGLHQYSCDQSFPLEPRDEPPSIEDVERAIAERASEERARKGALAAEQKVKDEERQVREAAILADPDGHVRGLLDSELHWPENRVSGAEVREAVASAAKRERARRSALAEEEKRARRQVREAWVTEHGSVRLRLTLEAGLLEASVRVYEEERRAKERPGWVLMPRAMQVKEVLNPKEDHLRALLDARASDPAVTMAWLFWPHDEDCGGDHDDCHCDSWRGAALVTSWTMPGGEPEEETLYRRL